ncbi:MAG: sulfate reduction electron transfer complex DsrMKJOP subunit DsrM [candidate division Zixibacteria bacterium]|nr:sulfate reduction electron transfer complex DsrMKJOP subunit DsrM [candidate division Zixibacteria bacterium]MDD5427358.1 sulfate reduction electron transfer complex DsrMKJOP subunit DsrM [candidate division Zixibacteria bacterium]
MHLFFSLAAVLVLLILVFIGVDVVGWRYLFGVVIPIATIISFILGMLYRVIKWARSPVPFRIPTTCGQQKSLSWIKAGNLESPHNIWGVLGRMVLEVLFFRSLFRNTKVSLKEGPRLVYGSTKWLWLGGLVFHWSFLVIFVRHFKFFAEPVPAWVMALQNLDGFFQVGLPIIYLTDIAFLAALTFLLLRRLVDPKLRYISLAADYFPLFLIIGIAVTGILMRYFTKVDIVGIKEMAMGWLNLAPVVPAGIGTLFYMHLFLVCCLFIYFPFSKLLHMAGVFFSPTRNLANTNRVKRHVNPWDYSVKVHTYEEYEDEFRDVMKAAEMPLEKE